MKEGIDPELLKKYNDQLAEEGMPEEPTPLPYVPSNTAGQELLEIFPEMELFLSQFKKLSYPNQKVVVEDIKNKRAEGLPASEILLRFEHIVQSLEQLELMSASDSDKKNKPKEVVDEEAEKKKKEDSEKLDRLIRDMETIIKRENHIPGRSTH